VCKVLTDERLSKVSTYPSLRVARVFWDGDVSY
jgi:hypothetical protein